MATKISVGITLIFVLLAISIFWYGGEQRRPEKSQSTPQVLLAASNQRDFLFAFPAPAMQVNTNRKLVHRLLVRGSDRLVLLNPFNDSQQDFLLPEELHKASFSAYALSGDLLLLQAHRGDWERGYVVDLLWVDTDGEVQKNKLCDLQAIFLKIHVRRCQRLLQFSSHCSHG